MTPVRLACAGSVQKCAACAACVPAGGTPRAQQRRGCAACTVCAVRKIRRPSLNPLHPGSALKNLWNHIFRRHRRHRRHTPFWSGTYGVPPVFFQAAQAAHFPGTRPSACSQSSRWPPGRLAPQSTTWRSPDESEANDDLLDPGRGPLLAAGSRLPGAWPALVPWPTPPGLGFGFN